MNKRELENMPGVIRVNLSKPYYTAEDICELLGVSKSYAYAVIRSLREQLVKEGRINEMYPKGKIPKKYFDKEFCIGRE